MLFKDISYLKLWQAFCSEQPNHLCNFSSWALWGIFLSNFIEFGPVIQEEILFKISYLELWWPFCLAERNHLSNFGRGHFRNYSCEIILNLNQWFRRRCRLKKKFMDDRKRPITKATRAKIRSLWRTSLEPLVNTVKPVLRGHLKIDKTQILMTNGSLMKVKSIAYLQYFWPALSDNRSWKPILVFFLSGRLRPVLL